MWCASWPVVRVLTRDASSPRAQVLVEKGVEVVEGMYDHHSCVPNHSRTSPGSIHDFPSVLAALGCVYGVYLNTDGVTLGEATEIFIGMRIFELAKQVGTLQHYVWSGLDYTYKVRRCLIDRM